MLYCAKKSPSAVSLCGFYVVFMQFFSIAAHSVIPSIGLFLSCVATFYIALFSYPPVTTAIINFVRGFSLEIPVLFLIHYCLSIGEDFQPDLHRLCQTSARILRIGEQFRKPQKIVYSLRSYRPTYLSCYIRPSFFVLRVFGKYPAMDIIIPYVRYCWSAMTQK